MDFLETMVIVGLCLMVGAATFILVAGFKQDASLTNSRRGMHGDICMAILWGASGAINRPRECMTSPGSRSRGSPAWLLFVAHRSGGYCCVWSCVARVPLRLARRCL
jgi:hypothetical protein